MKRKLFPLILPLFMIGGCLVSCDSGNGTNQSSKLSILITVVNGNGGGSYKIGEKVTITAKEVAGDTFIGWEHNGEIISTESTYTFIARENSGGKYTAVYSSSTKVSISVIHGTGTGNYDVGEIVNIVASSNDHGTFSHWDLNGETVSTNASYSFIASEDAVYTAIYDMEMVTLTVTNGTGSGTYEYGTSVTVMYNDKTGYDFIGWEIDGATVSTSSTYTFEITANTTITAVYSYNPTSFSKYVSNIEIKKGEEFKILNLTDIQLHDGATTDYAFDVIDTLVQKENPNMIAFLGDLINDSDTYDSQVNWKAVVDHIDALNIPWAPIFGNHDYEDYQTTFETKKTATSTDLENKFLASENCLYKKGPSDVSGKSNYVVNIVDKTTKEVIESLIFADSRLGGLDETSVSFYEDAVNYTKTVNDNVVAPSVYFTHIAIQQYGTLYTAQSDVEYKDLAGSVGRDSNDLCSGTNSLFPKMKELQSTKMVICGHDHENAFYGDYDGITLAYAMKSSEGDDERNRFSQIGGSILSVGNGKETLRYERVSHDTVVDKESATKNGSYYTITDNVPDWKSSGAKFEFDVTMPSTGSFRFDIQGTNFATDKKESYKKGMWNRLSGYIGIDAATKTADYGTLTNVSGNVYHYSLDLKNAPLNKGSGEIAYGDETARLVNFSQINAQFKLKNIHYEYDAPVTETNQLNLANAEITGVTNVFYTGNMVKPSPTVTLNSNTLNRFADYTVKYANNINKGEATLTIMPSVLGAHKYKGSKSITFNIIDNVDEDKVAGHENATTFDGESVVEIDTGNMYTGSTKEAWYTSGRSIKFDIKPLVNGNVASGNYAKMNLMGYNRNLPSSSVHSWNRFTAHYKVDFSLKKILDSGNNEFATLTDIGDGWYSVSIPLASFTLNTGAGETALGNNLEELYNLHFFEVKQSFRVDKVKAE